MNAGTRLLAMVSLCAMATTLAATLSTRTVAAGSASANLDQCANGPTNSPVHCSGSAWQNGNTNSNNSHWYEGDSIAYRARFSGLAVGPTHYVTIQWDTTKSGKHALDYVTSYNRTESVGNDPCSGAVGCGGSPSTFSIPPDTHTGLNLDPAYPSPNDGRWNQVFTMFNGTITSVTAKDPSLLNPEVPYNLTGTYSSDSSTSITITFTAASATPVLAWGGHIGNRKDWGPNNSAVAITGSPYHMRILDVDGSGGNQDRSTSSSAVIFPAILTITKNVLGNDGTNLYSSTPFNFTTTSPSLNNAPELPSGFTLVNDGGVNQQTTLPDNQTQFKLYLFGTTSPQVTITEQPTTGFFLTGLSCPTTLNGLPQASKTVDLASGTATIVANEGEYINCTYTNQTKATLTVYKNVVTTNGGTAGAGAFTLHVRGNGQDLSAPGSSSGTVYSLPAGVYTVSEDPVSGYAQTGFSGNCGATGSITLAVTGNYTCTITNHDLPAHLTLVKNLVKNNGGSALATDWKLSAAGPTPISGTTGAATVTNAAVSAGTYALSEAGGPSGYAASPYSCVKNGAAAVDGNFIQLANGDTATCTITNTDTAAHLTLVKHVTNNNGGTAQASDFTLSAAGPTPLTGAGSASSYVNGGTYTLSESGPSGYDAGAWSCSGGTFTASNIIQLTSGQSATCDITNDDHTAHLKLVKVVNNANGGTAQPTDFTLSANGPTPISGKGGADSDVNAGSYALSETSVAGYAAGTWACLGGTQTGASVTLGPGQSATCTITNVAQKAHLKLAKVVDNAKGGAAQPTDFTLSANGPTPISGSGGAESDVNAGNYALSETNIPGYTAGTWVCLGGTQTGASVTLGPGQSATCTITNVAQKAHLKLAKVVDNANGGAAQPTDFTLSANGATPISGSGGAESDVNAGSYALSETSLAGYSAGAWACVGGTQTGASVTLGPGQSATCTITNVAQKAHLKLVKVVNNNHGGTATPTDFTLSAVGPTSISGSGTAESDVNAGSYLLSETGLAGYTPSGWVCVGGIQSGASVTLGPGQSAVCTIINSDPKGSPTVASTMSWVLHDSLQISGLHAGAPNAGTIVFNLYGPSVTKTCADVDDVASGIVKNLLYTETLTGVTSSGTFPTQAGFRVNDPGTYRWVVSYSGDDFNNPASTTCGDETHTITVGEPTPLTQPQ